MPRMTHPDSTSEIEVTEEQQYQYETQGWRVSEGRPAKNASLEAWQNYAAARGVPTDGLTRDQLVDQLAALEQQH